ncbi:NADH:flavin oxidoreductase [Caldanaerobacter subterraneus subsp. yonseiensis KB-1]|uniref:NADH:flavin oxidoreductase n=1 Tax=Caldanaerobacter subterraneus subsp. yonseiensis KB-1 TaxID=1388761 RepID=U5CJG2_CALSX|nr:NAD(P)/FAD-dependent oxidoreductase [Caldanaerobacter subterraneus]ERM93080.1 NADH:flavin oxidoreductase [Caldanaerobacter subterraneus subsp. yonseiensis KB-1]
MELTKPIKLGGIELKNRLVMAPVKTGYATVEGQVTEELIGYYLNRAKGGVGLIVLESAYVDPSGKEIPRQLGIYDDSLVDGLKRLVTPLQEAGSKVAVYINHAGRVANPMATKMPLIAPSAVMCPSIGVEPKAIEKEEIKKWQKAYVDAAIRAYKAGADFLEIQFGHGYLIHQFLSPHANKRQDEYGGSFENRIRFGIEILEEIRSELPGFPVIVRISAEEFVEDGWKLEDTIKLVKILEEKGVAAIDVSLGTICEAAPITMQTLGTKKGLSWDYAEKIKREVNIPVIAVGRINSPDIAEEILSKGKADLVALGRPLVADPLFLDKAVSGRFKEIRRCLACHQGCFDELRGGRRFGCNINPAVGRSDEIEIPKAENPGKKVFIIGAGPAGLEAAYTAAVRGHKVTIYDENEELGGQLIAASMPPYKEELMGIVEYYKEVLPKLGVEIKLNHRVTAEEVAQWEADAIIFATGGEPIVLSIPGLKEYGYMTAAEVLKEGKETGQTVVIIGGGLIGMETADYLSEKGKKVMVIELLDEVARDMGVFEKNLLMKRLKERDVEIYVKTKLKEVNKSLVTETLEGERNLPLPDTIVLSVGMRPNRTLYEEVKKFVPEEKLYLIGDAKEVRKIVHAISEGRNVALTI